MALDDSLIVCGIYYYFWAKLIPQWKGYEMRQELVDLGGGAETHVISKIPVNELMAWDINHDTTGTLRGTAEKEHDRGLEKDTHAPSGVDSKVTSTICITLPV